MSTRNHYLIPAHSLLNADEKKQLLSQLHVTIKELPKIKITDPAVQSLDAQSGDVIKIVRQSRSAGESTYYRVVIE